MVLETPVICLLYLPLTLVVVLELLGFILQCLLGCRAGGVHRCTLHVHLLSVFNLPVHP
jgi:hypothetical protein